MDAILQNPEALGTLATGFGIALVAVLALYSIARQVQRDHMHRAEQDSALMERQVQSTERVAEAMMAMALRMEALERRLGGGQ